MNYESLQLYTVTHNTRKQISKAYSRGIISIIKTKNIIKLNNVILAIENNQYHIVKWVKKSIKSGYKFSNCFTKTDLNRAAIRGYIDILNFALELKKPKLPDQCAINSAARNGMESTIRWASRIPTKYGGSIYPDQTSMNLAAKNGRLNIIKIVLRICKQKRLTTGKRIFLPTRTGVNDAARKGRTDVLILCSKFPLKQGGPIIASEGSIKTGLTNERFVLNYD